jgi:16S rRNA (cytosine967-C5)-methyltransferase
MIPEFLYNKLINQYGENITNKIINGYNENKIVSLRVNTIKTTKEEILKVLNDNNITYEEIFWYDSALVVNVSEAVLTNLDIYKNGFIYSH